MGKFLRRWLHVLYWRYSIITWWRFFFLPGKRVHEVDMFFSRLVLVDLKIIGSIKIVNQIQIEYLNRKKSSEYGGLK